jgi:pteridine reductase
MAPKIRVNAVGPGLIQFPNDVSNEHLIQKIPMGRPGRGQEVAETVYFLLAGPKYITGQLICVDGGWSIAP